jgi:hypothetical protein
VGIKASLYADDAALFVHPCNEGILCLKEILKAFGDATGLHTNIQKIEIYPIRCDEFDLDHNMDTSLVGIWVFLFTLGSQGKLTSCHCWTKWGENCQDGRVG